MTATGERPSDGALKAMRDDRMHEFRMDGAPLPKARPRVTLNGTYTPERTAQYERDLAWTAKALRVPLIADGPITLEVAFVFAWPKRTPKKDRTRGRHYHAKRPDIDNLLKAVKDALNGVCWADDAQVSWVRAYKEYGSEAHTLVRYGRLD